MIKQRRIVVLLGSVGVVFLIWMLFFHQSEDDLLHSRSVEGMITEIHERPSNTRISPKRQNRQSDGIVVAVVELIPGPHTETGHARILIPRGKHTVGNRVPLTLKLYNDGTRKVLLAAPTVDTASQTPQLE